MAEKLPTGKLANYAEIINESLLLAHEKIAGNFPRSQVEVSVSAIAGAKADLTVLTHKERALLPPSWVETYLTLHVAQGGEDGYPLATASLVHAGGVILGQTIDKNGLTTKYDPSKKHTPRLMQPHPSTSIGVVTGIGDIGSAAIKIDDIMQEDGILITGVNTAHELLAGVVSGEFHAGISLYPSVGHNRHSSFAANAPMLAAIGCLGLDIRSAGNNGVHEPWDLSFIVGPRYLIGSMGAVASNIIHGR